MVKGCIIALTLMVSPAFAGEPNFDIAFQLKPKTVELTFGNTDLLTLNVIEGANREKLIHSTVNMITFCRSLGYLGYKIADDKKNNKDLEIYLKDMPKEAIFKRTYNDAVRKGYKNPIKYGYDVQQNCIIDGL